MRYRVCAKLNECPDKLSALGQVDQIRPGFVIQNIVAALSAPHYAGLLN